MLRGCIYPGQWGKLWQACTGWRICPQFRGAPRWTLPWGCLRYTSVGKGALASIQLRFVVLQDYTTAMGNTVDMVRGTQIKERERAGERIKGRKCKIVWIQNHQWWVLNYTSLWKVQKPFLLKNQNWSSFHDHALMTFCLAGTECDWFCC